MKKYVWSYNSSNVSIREPTVDLLCEKINTFEKLNENDNLVLLCAITLAFCFYSHNMFICC